MAENLSNIVLIGMPGSGKSTVGVILAKMTSHDFVDTDVL
ncbi:MAG: shikimate kinase, partial [Deltaproteobacteria bacterium]|nr:shikimate kinase [Deltaproteobacteria bacterium]